MDSATIAATGIAPTLISSGIKTGLNAVSLAIIKQIQAFSELSEEKLLDAINAGKLQLEALLVSCTGIYSTPLNEEQEIKKILCQIKRNKANNDPALMEKTFSDLCAIINTYSNNKYIAMSKEVYTDEKLAAKQALYNFAVSSSLTNLGTDTAMSTISGTSKSAAQFFSSTASHAPPASKAPTPSSAPATPPAPDSGAIASTLAVKSALGVAVAMGNVAIGIAIFDDFKRKIPSQYIPDFKFLTTMLATLQKQKDNINQLKYDCLNRITRENVKEIIELFKIKYPNRYSSGAPKKRYSNNFIENYRINRQDVKNINEKDINFNKFTFDSLGSNYSIIQGLLDEECTAELVDDNRRIDMYIDNIKGLIREYSSIFDMRAEGIKLIDISHDLNTLLNNYNLEEYNDTKIREIRIKIDELKQEKLSQNTGQSTIAKASNAFTSIIRAPETLFFPKGKGGKKSKHNRKRKTQKQNRKTRRHR